MFLRIMCYDNMNIILNVLRHVGFCKHNFSETVFTSVLRKNNNITNWSSDKV